MANVYFLFIMVLQVIPPISITGGQPAILLPLLFVVVVSAIKDLFEDLKRHSSDDQENNRKVLVANPQTASFEYKAWKELRVGNVIKIFKDEYFPADLILLNSSAPKGICYIETKNLDGETNLKHKLSNKDIMQYCQIDQEATTLAAEIQCEKPSDKIYQFEGLFKLSNNKKISISYESFLLRGSSLRNTDWIYGVVIFPGHDTRIMMNSTSSRAKFSRVEKQTNINILLIFGLQLILCLIATIYGTIWRQINLKSTYPYLELIGKDHNSIFDQSWFLNAIQRYGTWLLLFTNMVPISLMVTLEVVKFFQAFFIQWDHRIYDLEKDMPTQVQASNLNEELGQVQYIFSDKTGTLTCNIMDFKKFSAGKFSYGISGSDNRQQMIFHGEGEKEEISNVSFDDPLFYQHFKEKKSINYEYIEKILLNLALCHTVIIEQKNGKISYNAASPDELALVNAARFFGFKFVDRDEENIMTIEFQGEKFKYELLNLVEFNSTRKRMSVIVRDQKGIIKCLCKGADSILFPLLKQCKESQELQKITNQFLEEYAKEGLRTLLIVEKTLTEQEFERWNDKYQEACLSIQNREEKIFALAEELEKDFNLVGSTAIEDKLQDGVGDTIQSFKNSGIKLWVLTGDKIETAINIGYSCQLLNNDMTQCIIDGKNSREVLEQIAEGKKNQALSQFVQDNAIIVSGDSLLKIAANENIKESFLNMTDYAKVVIACRVSPKQKAEIVTFVRHKFPRATTLAIGDGANDVNMITAAHVGVGISGLEGQQAARSSDYAIGQFKFLKNIIFTHGREAYRRNSYLVCYIFYKNILFVLPQFWFGFVSAMSGQTLYEAWIYQMFNIVFTCFPIMWFAVFDSEHRRDKLLTTPKFYKIGLLNECFSRGKFWRWIAYGAWQAGFIMFLAFYTLEGAHPAYNAEGDPSCLVVSGTIVYALVVVVANTKIAFSTHTHTIWSGLVIILSILSFFLLYHMENDFRWIPSLYKTFYNTMIIPSFYMLIIFFVLSVIAFEALFHYTNKMYLKRKENRLKEKERKRLLKLQEQESILMKRRETRHMGFAFSQEAGQAPQITRSLSIVQVKPKSSMAYQTKKYFDDIKEVDIDFEESLNYQKKQKVQQQKGELTYGVQKLTPP